ncbi:MAG: hypothetical protein JW774_11015, partial [Candidatus Aureabacteria bacterium]|nr:hypothetical protein [Candidatus Auribacterota bacterium]
MNISSINYTYEFPQPFRLIQKEGYFVDSRHSEKSQPVRNDNVINNFYWKKNEEIQKYNQTENTNATSADLKKDTVFDLSGTRDLSEKEKKELEALKARDTEVRQHESAHQAVGGALASMPQYEYRRGPDGKFYAVGGHVTLNTSRGRTPEETISRAEQIRRAALAPKNPSASDRRVAMEATQMENEARQKIAKRNLEKMKAYMQNMKTSMPNQPVIDLSKLNSSRKEDTTDDPGETASVLAAALTASMTPLAKPDDTNANEMKIKIPGNPFPDKISAGSEPVRIKENEDQS